MSLPERFATVSIKPAPETDSAKKSKIARSLAALATPSLLRSTSSVVPSRLIPMEPAAGADKEIVAPGRLRISVPPASWI
jgi:hypothetical protein